MKVRLPREVQDPDAKTTMAPGVYDVASIEPYSRGGFVLSGPDWPAHGMLLSASEFIRLNDDGTLRVLRVEFPNETLGGYAVRYAMTPEQLWALVSDVHEEAMTRVMAADLLPGPVNEIAKKEGWW